MASEPHAPTDRKKMALVLTASSAGTVFEWYDFFIYGSVAPIIAKHFFAAAGETQGYILTLLTFAAGFFARPFGAIVFGRLGDRTGRKRTFLVTITVMGAATFLAGLLPDASVIGVAAPWLLVALRVAQGFAIGGEYGGAAIYVAEHARGGQSRRRDRMDSAVRLHRTDPGARSDSDRAARDGRCSVRRLGLAHSLPAFRDTAGYFAVDPAAAGRIALVPAHSRRGATGAGALAGSAA